MLRGYKEIASCLSDIWETPVSLTSVVRWSSRPADPLPLRRINPSDGERSIVLASRDDLTSWALRKIQ